MDKEREYRWQCDNPICNKITTVTGKLKEPRSCGHCGYRVLGLMRDERRRESAEETEKRR